MLNRLTRFVLLLTLAVPAAAYAWNDVGHMTVAEIAWQKLSPEERTAVSDLLKQHPSYATYFNAEVPAGASVDEWAFLRAATWPDWVRPARPGDRQFKDATITRYHHGPWHYTDLPFVTEGATAPAAKGATSATQPAVKDLDVIGAIAYNRADLTNPATAPLDRAVALSWIEHLVGDIHQPLHAASMYSKQYPDGDKGGNDQAIRTESGVMNLHSQWDEMLGTTPNYRMISFLASDIMADPRCDVSKRPEYLEHKTAASWAQESHDYAVAFVYLDGKLKTMPLKEAMSKTAAPEVPAVPPMYLQNARDVARVRIALAGSRLAEMLHAALAK